MTISVNFANGAEISLAMYNIISLPILEKLVSTYQDKCTHGEA